MQPPQRSSSSSYNDNYNHAYASAGSPGPPSASGHALKSTTAASKSDYEGGYPYHHGGAGSLLNRPVSLGNLLFQQTNSSTDGRGELPRSSSPSSLISPTASVYSLGSSHGDMTSHTTANNSNATTQRAHKVVLPSNERGVRTRVNILPPSRLGNLATSKESRERPASSASTLLLGGGTSDSGSSRTSIDVNSGGKRFSSLSHLHQTTSASAGHPVFNMLSASRRNVSESVLSNANGSSNSSGGNSHVPRPASPALTGVASTMPYTFPPRPVDGKTYMYPATSSSTGFMPQTPETHHATSYSQSSTASSNSNLAHPFTPTGTVGAGNASVYTTPASSASKASPGSSFSLTGGEHLQTLPKSLIPGGYDFSPASVHESQSNQSHHNHQTPGYAGNHMQQQKDQGTPTPFNYARDRSASVPRTVSSLGDSRRSSSEDFHRQFGSGPGGPLANDSGHGLDSSNSPQLRYQSNGAGSSSSSGRPSEDHYVTRGQGESYQEEGQEESFTMPQISPVPPQLDLDFGNFSLDFGSTFGSGSLNFGFDTSAVAAKPVNSKPQQQQASISLSPESRAGPGFSFNEKLAPEAKKPLADTKSSDMFGLGIGLGFPPRRPSVVHEAPEAEAPEPEERRQPKDTSEDDDRPLASLRMQREPSITEDDEAVGVQEARPMIPILPKAVSPLSQLAASASTSSLLDLTSPSLSLHSAERDRTPKASSAIQPSFAAAASQQTSYRAPQPVSSFVVAPVGSSSSRPDSPASNGTSSFSGSRPASSLLAHQQGRPRLDSMETDSKRTTLSSNENGHKVVANQSLGTGSSSLTARLSINKTLPAIPGTKGAASDEVKYQRPSNLRMSSSIDVGSNNDDTAPRPRRSMSESVKNPAQFQRNRGDSKASQDSTTSSNSNASSLDNQPLHQLYPLALQNRSRSTTLEDKYAGGSNERGPHGSAASNATNNTMRLDLADMGVRDHPAGPRMLAKTGGLEKPKAQKHDAWEGGELVKKDAATDKLLMAATAKLVAWLDTPAYEARERIIARRSMSSRTADTPTDSGSVSEAAGAMSDPSRKGSFESSRPPQLSAKVVSASSAVAAAAPVRINKADAVALKDKTNTSPPVLPPAPAVSLSSSLSEKPLFAALAHEAASKSALRLEPKRQNANPASTLSVAIDPVAPLRILSKSPSNVSLAIKKPPKAEKIGGELPFSKAWTEMEAAHNEYKAAVKAARPDRASSIQTGFIPKFKQEELTGNLARSTLSKRQSDLLFDWVDTLFLDLQGAPANRGACLDGIAVVVESRFMNYFSFEDDPERKKRLQHMIASLLQFAIDKLNGKAIFANTLGFAGKILAAAFWTLDGVALKMLRLLPAVKKQHMLRILTESGMEDCPGTFPPHVSKVAYQGNVGSYIRLFPPVRPGADQDTHLYSGKFDQKTPLKGTEKNTKEKTDQVDITIEMAGNWLIRWTATDSDLPFAFMRAYHRQLANYLPAFEDDQISLKTAQLVKAPGYLFIMATLLEVCDALIHRNLRSVTTMAPSNTGVNANESANLAAGQKPKALEVVSKRVVQTIFEVVGGPLQSGTVTSTPQAYASAAMRSNFGCSLRVWIAAVTKRTSMWDTRGIFALLDLVEGLLFIVCSPPLEEGATEDEDDVWQPSEVGLALFDTQFILSFIKTILSKADNTTCLLRTISFLYTEFSSFTQRPADREELCDRIVLDADIFSRLFLYYNVGVRGYFLRLLVYRMARLGSTEEGKPFVRDPRIIATLRLFESRLEKVRKRHDELDPIDDEWDSEDSEDEFRPRAKRSTICSTWGVHDKPWIIDENLRKASSEASDEERHPDFTEQNLTVEAIGDQPHPPQMSPPILLNQSANSSSATLGKANKLSAAKKVAGGWWNNLKNRKGSGTQPKNKNELLDQIHPFYDDVTGGSNATLVNQRTSDGVSSHLASSPPAQQYSAPAKSPSHSRESSIETKPQLNIRTAASEANSLPPQVPDLLKVEPTSPRLRKIPSRKSIRRAPSVAGAASATSRSRRSSLYSFDLGIDTPRSDSFDFPASPLSATAGSPTSPTGAGSLSISPVAFGALMEGALTFSSGEEGPNGVPSPSRPGHKRGKSVNSVRKSRPASVTSERTGPSPRVSKRFSKRASILPPPALDLLKESPSEPVPKIPEQYKTPTSGNTQNGLFASTALYQPPDRGPSPPPYEQKKHAYAIRGLREYEDCLDEWELFVHRAKEEEGADGRELSALIPRLQCAWPSTWEE